MNATINAIQSASDEFASQQLDGSHFPDGVLALTWDDGPDVHTLELAEFLHSRHVAGTFFVVREWRRGESDDPGTGKDVYRTGYVRIPILEQLVRLGHRLGNHTANHRLLTRIAPGLASEQLEVNQRYIEPFLSNELRIFRVPGGDWDGAVAEAVRSNPNLATLIGPVRWDIDAKDWQSSIECDSTLPGVECEKDAGRLRTKPSVIAHRYLEAIERRGRGIVLLHDRVGNVGSRYPVEVAELLVTQLQARGFVFAAPVLGFSPMRLRIIPTTGLSPGSAQRAQIPLVDADATACANALPISPSFGAVHIRSQLADVDGDGRLDCCTVTPKGILCALSTGFAFAAPERWSVDTNFGLGDKSGWFTSRAYYDTIRFADINGDGRADICGRAADGVICALSTGRSFTSGSNWLRTAMVDSDGWLRRDPSSLRLVDVNGDGRADLCISDVNELECALAP